MRDWDYTTATSAIGKAQEVIDAARHVIARLPAAGFASETLEARYEAAKTPGDLDSLVRVTRSEVAAADAVADALAAIDGEGDPVAQVGLIATDVSAPTADAINALGTLDTARASQRAAELQRVAADAWWTGAIRIGAAVIVGLLVLAGFVLLVLGIVDLAGGSKEGSAPES
jgi:hypothetical protein